MSGIKFTKLMEGIYTSRPPRNPGTSTPPRWRSPVDALRRRGPGRHGSGPEGHPGVALGQTTAAAPRGYRRSDFWQRGRRPQGVTHADAPLPRAGPCYPALGLGRSGGRGLAPRPWDSASAAAAFAAQNTRPPPKSRAAAAFPLEIFAAAGRPVVCPSRRLRGRVPKGPRRSACCLRVAAVFSGAARRGDYPALALARNEDLHRDPRPPPSQPPFKVQAAAKIINGRPEGRSNSPPSVGGP
jgi:hypothetical protein